MKTIYILSACALLLSGMAQAHRSGCHRWHTCPSDTGSYTMGSPVTPAPRRGVTAPAVAPARIVANRTQVTTTSVNMRTGPASTYRKVTTLAKGTRVSVITCAGGWCQVAAARGTGFVSQKYLR